VGNETVGLPPLDDHAEQVVPEAGALSALVGGHLLVHLTVG
jgi:hypothetical protein